MTEKQATILVVDEDDTARAEVAFSLMNTGYQVLEAADGEQALILIKKLDSIDALLTEVELADVIGVDVAIASRDRWPDLPVLFMAEEADVADLEELVPGCAVVSKSVDSEIMIDELDRIIEGEDP